MPQFKTFKLGDAINLVKDGYTPSLTEHLHYIGLEHIEQQTLRLAGIGKSSDVTSNKFRFKSGDILFGKLRPYFRKVYRPKFDGVCSTDIWVVRAKKNFDQGFIYYLMASEEFVDLSSQGSSGTRMPRADWNNLKNIEWEFPSLPTQTRIAAILSSLDDKIELNRRTNATLEAMAQTLFKKYFVEDIDPDNLPDGWRMASLNELMDFEGGMQPPANQFIDIPEHGYVRLIQIRDYESDSNITYVPLKNNLRFCNRKDVMIARYGASVARVCYGLDGAYNVALVKVKPHKPFYTEFLRTYLKSKDCQEKIINMSFRSVQAGFNKDDFKSIIIPVPNDDQNFISYENEVSILIDKILRNREQNKVLAKTRDSLLPKLMSGEIEVNAAENELVS